MKPRAANATATRLSPDSRVIRAELPEPGSTQSTAQLALHQAALALTLDRETLATLAALAEPPSRYWRTRSALRWT